MGDWLKTFGTFQANLPATIGVNDYYIPTNRKSLVVSSSTAYPLGFLSDVFIFIFIY